jgi:amino acid adenylation domain-containing protein/non-ribosomal peptide synthase protein (TIGR01720 family)
MRVALVHFGSGRPDRVLLVIHHVAMDGVSWRILLDDLQTAYDQLRKGQPIQLPPKTTSFKQWAEGLVAYAHSEALEQEVNYWQEVVNTPCAPLPRDVADGGNTVASTGTVTVALTREETQALLQDIPAVYHTHINDVLLTALVDALAQWTKQERVLINLEGHGREALFEGIDLSRTVGWFTSIFPVALKRAHSGHPGESLKAVKEQLRQIPHRGIGYGLLRYLTHDTDLQAHLGEPLHPEISFNYLGQFDQVLPGSALFTRSTASKGPTRSPRGHRSHLLEINGMINGGMLQMQWGYSEHVHKRATIEALAQNYLAALGAVILHCQSPGAGGYTPSDFPLARISQRELDEILTHVPTGDGRPKLADLYPLTPLQQGLWFHALAAPEAGIYFEQGVTRLEGEVDLDVLRRAWEVVVARHGILRTSLVWEGLDHPLQLVHPSVALPWKVEDWRGSAAGEEPARLRNFLEADRIRGFDLTHAPLMRLTLIQVAESTALFVWSFHHLILDRWSLEVVLKEVWAAYEALRDGQAVPEEAPSPFRDFLGWLQEQDLGKAERYWRHTLKGFTAPTQLGVELGVAPGGHQPGHYATEQLTISEPATVAMNRLAREQKVTLNTLVQGAWAVVLSRYSGTEDVVFGTTSSGRSVGLKGVETMVGLFINTLPVRVHVDPTQSVVTWLKEMQAQQVAMREYEYTPIFEIQKWSEVSGGVPLFNTLMVFENTPGDGPATGGAEGITVKRIPGGKGGVTNYPLNVIALPGRILHLVITYDTEHYAAGAITRLLGHVQQVLAEMVAEPEQPLGTMSVLTKTERQQLLVEWNATETAYPRDVCIHDLFEAQVEQTPDAVALVFGEDTLTYDELNTRANHLAHYLHQQYGVGPEVCVGVCVERSLEMVVGILGILKAGGAYVPLDPNAPPGRLAFMLKDAGIAVLLTQAHLRANLPEFLGTVLALDADWDTALSVGNLMTKTSTANLAYVIYTSGSTGTPKGVMIPHSGVVNYLSWATSAYEMAQGDGAPVYSSLGFDFTITSLFGPLVVGQRIILLPEEIRAEELCELLHLETELSVLKITPAHLELMRTRLSQEDFKGRPRFLIIGGEALLGEHLAVWQEQFPTTRVINEYGPTEGVVGCCTFEVPTSDPLIGPVLIGRPSANTQLYVLDYMGQLVPMGVQGELYIGGTQVARGYLGRPDLTAERFVPHPFSAEPGARLYRTGDQARYRADGTLEFLGRVDHQVKLRGFRIELGEIEAVMMQHPGIQEAVALVREDRPSDPRLVAYVVASHEPTPTFSELRSFLKEKLPVYMIPSAFVFLDLLPLTPNGKVDRPALPTPDLERSRLETKFVAPRTPVEKVLAKIWSEVLGLECVGVHDNFFELGGHSLLATQVMSRARGNFKMEFPFLRFFETPTIAGLTEVIETIRLTEQRPRSYRETTTSDREEGEI